MDQVPAGSRDILNFGMRCRCKPLPQVLLPLYSTTHKCDGIFEMECENKKDWNYIGERPDSELNRCMISKHYFHRRIVPSTTGLPPPAFNYPQVERNLRMSHEKGMKTEECLCISHWSHQVAYLLYAD
jgi:hypothetical protein